jgi:hypothetical protein
VGSVFLRAIFTQKHKLTTHAWLELEDDIEKLESKGADLSGVDKQKLEELKKELVNINKKKEEYVAEHPEHRKLVFKARKTQRNDEEKEEVPKPQARNLFNKNGLPRHPERSIYYDPVLNPYGVPPPGMPYIERRMLIANSCLNHRLLSMFSFAS